MPDHARQGGTADENSCKAPTFRAEQQTNYRGVVADRVAGDVIAWAVKA
jgi:hypothetical protein